MGATLKGFLIRRGQSETATAATITTPTAAPATIITTTTIAPAVTIAATASITTTAATSAAIDITAGANIITTASATTTTTAALPAAAIAVSPAATQSLRSPPQVTKQSKEQLDKNWRPIWINVEETLKNKTQSMCKSVKLPTAMTHTVEVFHPTSQTAVGRPIDPTSQAAVGIGPTSQAADSIGPTSQTAEGIDPTSQTTYEEITQVDEEMDTTTQAENDNTTQTAKRRAEMIDRYEKAIKNGAETMSCGRIAIVGNTNKAQELISSLTGKDDGRSICTITDDGKLSTMTEEAELLALATLANKVIETNSSSVLKDMKDMVVKAFKGNPGDAPDPTLADGYVPDDISNGVQKIVTEIMKRTIDCAFETSPASIDKTPALIHVSKYPWDLIKILPILITSRSLFLFMVSDKDTNEYICHCIACIISSLSCKATNLFGNLPKLKGKNCGYPRILVVETCSNTNEQLTHTPSKLDSIQKWMRSYCSDSAQAKCEVNTTGPANVFFYKQATEFIARDLLIPIPLSWELFRQMLLHVTKNIKFVQIEKVAKLASLCDIAIEEFLSVLTFFHEHGILLYYADVEILQNIVIIDPQWLQDKLLMLFDPNPNQSHTQQMWERLLKNGILVPSLCQAMWQSEEVEDLPKGLVKLLERHRLAALIEIQNAEIDIDGPKYFLPFVMKKKEISSSCSVSSNHTTAPLHFIFPVTKQVPLGLFNFLNVALASQRQGAFAIDFSSEMFSNQITYWFRNKWDKVILSETSTSITVVVERVILREGGYKEKNFWQTCHEISLLLTKELDSVLRTSFKDVCVQSKPAFQCTCSSEEVHYVDQTAECTGDIALCEKKKQHKFCSSEMPWFPMVAPTCTEGKLHSSEIKKVLELLCPNDLAKLLQEMEITTQIDCCENGDHNSLVTKWSEQMEKMEQNARKILMYHLKRLSLAKAAFQINHGLHLNKEEPIKNKGAEALQYIYSNLIDKLNPDDVIPKLYSKKLLSHSEMDEINNDSKATQKRTTLLLEAVRRSTVMEFENFLTFLDILDECGYKVLVEKARMFMKDLDEV